MSYRCLAWFFFVCVCVIGFRPSTSWAIPTTWFREHLEERRDGHTHPSLATRLLFPCARGSYCRQSSCGPAHSSWPLSSVSVMCLAPGGGCVCSPYPHPPTFCVFGFTLVQPNVVRTWASSPQQLLVDPHPLSCPSLHCPALPLLCQPLLGCPHCKPHGSVLLPLHLPLLSITPLPPFSIPSITNAPTLLALKTPTCQSPVAHTCSPSYSGGREQENHSLKPVQANSLRDPILKIPNTEKGWWSGSRCRPWVQTPVPKDKKKNS
jgi:hypothetical protein